MVARVVFVLAGLGIVQCRLLNSCNDTKSFVDGHNARRLNLVRGDVPNQPAASQMNLIIWDDELATKALNWASKGEQGHNPDTTIPSGRFEVGENLYGFSTTDNSFEFDPELAMAAWWDEHEDYTYGELSVEQFNEPKQIGHYTQMAWANTIRVGCGISQDDKDGWNNFVVVCNYGPAGNFIGEPPYNTGGRASRNLVCGESDSDCSKKYGDRC